METNRSTLLLGRVRREVGELSADKLLDSEVFDAMQQTQKDIAARTKCIESIVIIVTVANQESYSVENVAGIKGIRPPSTYRNDIVIVANVNYPTYKRRCSAGYGYPQIATIDARKLFLYPIPTTSGEEIELDVYLSCPQTTISESVEPETPDYLDDAIQYGTIARLVEPERKALYLQMYNEELRAKGNIAHNKHYSDRQTKRWW